MKVYRVEMPGSGAGPYSPKKHGIPEWEWKAEAALDQMYIDHEGNLWEEPSHPTPRYEIPDTWDVDREWGDFNCGFESLASMRQWFGPWLSKLQELGFMVATYNVPEEYVRKGAKQLIFFKGEASLMAYDHLLAQEMRLAA